MSSSYLLRPCRTLAHARLAEAVRAVVALAVELTRLRGAAQ